MFDLHLHILANVDDGPAHRDESEAMLRLAASIGFTHLVATPHLHEALATSYRERVEEEQHWLATVAEEVGITLGAGYEIRLSPDLGKRLESGEPVTLGASRTVLVELPFAGWPTFTDQALFDAMTAGFRPLLAHPERYAAALDNPDLIYALHERGVMMQLTTGSLAGLFGKRSREVAERFLRDGIIDILASDAHSAGRRFVSVAEGIARAEELVGPHRTEQLTIHNPRALLADQPLPPAALDYERTIGEPRWRQSLTRVKKQLIPRR